MTMLRRETRQRHNPLSVDRPEGGFNGEGGGDSEAKIYDIFGELSAEAKPYGVQLILMAGEMGAAFGYFFEKESSDYLNRLAQISVADKEGRIVATLPSKEAVFRALYVEIPDWYNPQEQYRMMGLAISEVDFENLWELRKQLLTRLQIDGMDAAQEFVTIGVAMGGKTQEKEELAQRYLSMLT